MPHGGRPQGAFVEQRRRRRPDHDAGDDEGDDGPGHDQGDDENDDHGDDEDGDDVNEHGDDDDDQCSADALKAGTKVHEAELEVTSAGKHWEELELIEAVAPSSGN